MAKIKTGDIIEISTPKGLAYAQYTHDHKMMGNLIRVKRGLYPQRPALFTDIPGKENQIITFIPLKAMLDQNIVTIAANESIPERDRSFPVFRNGMRNPKDGTIKWWLWDGQKEWPVGFELTEEQKKYPVLGTWNDTLLIERIVSGWTHEGAPF